MSRDSHMVRVHPELVAMHSQPDTDQLRKESYQGMYEKLPVQEKADMDIFIERAKTIHNVGDLSALELIVAVAQFLDWADYPERE